MAQNYWIIDTDAGVDDCQALVLAFSSPLIEVVGVTTVAGNVDLPKVVKNTAETLRVCGRQDVPYYIGSKQPLISPLIVADAIHGPDGLNNYWTDRECIDLPSPAQKSAVEGILELANKYAGNLNIATIGPLTNLALAVAIDPDLPKKFKRVMVMGAAVHGKGNRTVCAEFNVWCDPEAAFIVFDRFPLIELVPWETCIAPEHQFTLEFLHQYTSGATEKGRFINGITKVHEGKSKVFFCDPITIAIAIDPTIALKTVSTEAWVELSGKTTRGMTVVNWKKSDEAEVNSLTRHANVAIVESLDIGKIQELFLSSVRN